jgi:hypothetical protein
VTETAAIHAFAEITNWTSQCGLCQLTRTNPNVLFVVHQLYEGGLSGRPLMKKIEPVFAEAKEKLPARQTFMRHFENHYGVQKTKLEKLAEPAIGAPVALSAQDEASDYTELRTIYNDFREIFETVKTEFKQAKDAKQKTSDYGLVMLIKLAGELRQTLKTLSDMRNSEKLLNLILVRYAETLIGNIAEPLGVQMRVLRDRLIKGEDPQVVAEQINVLLGGELFPLFESAAQNALEQSRQQYKLH